MLWTNFMLLGIQFEEIGSWKLFSLSPTPAGVVELTHYLQSSLTFPRNSMTFPRNFLTFPRNFLTFQVFKTTGKPKL